MENNSRVRKSGVKFPNEELDSIKREPIKTYKSFFKVVDQLPEGEYFIYEELQIILEVYFPETQHEIKQVLCHSGDHFVSITHLREKLSRFQVSKVKTYCDTYLIP